MLHSGTLNQRVQGSSPCAPTNTLKYLTSYWLNSNASDSRAGFRAKTSVLSVVNVAAGADIQHGQDMVPMIHDEPPVTDPKPDPFSGLTLFFQYIEPLRQLPVRAVSSV